MLPPLIALALRGDAWSEYAAAHMMAVYAGPFLCVQLLALGVFPSILVRWTEPTRAEMFVNSAGRAALALTSGVAAVWIIVPPDLSYPLGPMWRMLAWLGGLGLPMWANALFLRLEGEFTLRTLARAVGIGVASAGAAVVAGVLLVLPIEGLLVPVAVGGMTYTAGMAIASWRDVDSPVGDGARPWAEVMMVTAVISAAVSLTIAVRVANPPSDTLMVGGIQGYDPVGQRLSFSVVRRASMLQNVAEIDLETGEWWEFGRRDLQIAYAAGRRVIARSAGVSYTLGTEGGVTLCRETEAGSDCGPSLGPERGLILRGHDSRPLVVANRGSELIAWDVQDDRRWRVHRPHGTIRWPCFAAGPSLYFRVQRDLPPYDQELLDLTTPDSTPTPLPLMHEYGCEDVGRAPRAARFDRGRRRANQPSVVRGPGLPDEGVPIVEQVVSASWSDDGRTLAMVMDNATLRYYRADLGVTDPVEVDSRGTVTMNAAGTLAANQYSVGRSSRFKVRTVPEHEVVLSAQPYDGGPIIWDRKDRIVARVDGRLVRFDPATGEEEVLFPPGR